MLVQLHNQGVIVHSAITFRGNGWCLTISTYWSSDNTNNTKHTTPLWNSGRWHKPEKKSRRDSYKPLLKVRPLMEHLQLAWMAYYSSGQNISFDEKMMTSKARFLWNNTLTTGQQKGVSSWMCLPIAKLKSTLENAQPGLDPD